MTSYYVINRFDFPPGLFDPEGGRRCITVPEEPGKPERKCEVLVEFLCADAHSELQSWLLSLDENPSRDAIIQFLVQLARGKLGRTVRAPAMHKMRDQ